MGGRDHSCEVCGRGGFNDPDGTCECIPKSAGDLKREYEEMGRDRDGLVEKAADRLYDVLSAQLEEERDAAGESSVHESTWRVIGALREAGWLRERPPLAEYQRGYRDGHWEGMQECGRPPLTEEERKAVVDFLGEREALDGFDGWNGAAKRLLYSAAAKLRVLTSSTTEEQGRG